MKWDIARVSGEFELSGFYCTLFIFTVAAASKKQLTIVDSCDTVLAGS